MKICSGNKTSKWAVTFLRLYVFSYKSRDVFSSKSSKQFLKQLYFLFIHNYMNYTNIAWASISKSKLGRLYRCQNMLLVFVFILCHREGFSHLQDVWDILEWYGSTMLCCEYHFRFFCQVSSSSFPKMFNISLPKAKLDQTEKLERNDVIYLPHKKMIHSDIGYKLASNQNRWVTKRY